MACLHIVGLYFFLSFVTVAYTASVSKNDAIVACRAVCSIFERKDRSGNKSCLTIEDINLDLCTHLIIGRGNYAEPLKWTLKSQSLSDKSDEIVALEHITALKNRKKDLKIIMSLDYSPSDVFELINYDRKKFVQDAKNFIKKHNFDGLNFNTYYAIESLIGSDGREKFVAIIKDLKTALKSDGKLLTTSLATAPWAVKIVISDLMDLFDYWFVLPIEYFGTESEKIMPHAPMETNETVGVKKSVKDVINLYGLSTSRLILGISFYGKKYELMTPLDDIDNPIGKPFVHNAITNNINNRLTYKKMCPLIKSKNWRYGWDSLSQTPYLVKNLTVITYENEESVAAKVKLARDEKFAGVMIFSIEMDDFDGDCVKGMKYPLLQTVNDNLK